MLLSCDKLSKSFGDRILFSELSFSLDKNERLCILGRNGCGKSTLLNIILGNEEYDAGDIKKQDVKISCLSQAQDTNDTRSGGEKTKQEIQRVFNENPSILLLDEPTNHLDIEGIEELEKKIASFRGGLILVSHDRYLIDKFATKILDLNTVPHVLYSGNYSDFLVKKSQLKLSIDNANKKLASKISHEKEVIAKLQSFNREKSIKRAESRKKALAKMEDFTKFNDDSTKMNIVLSPRVISGNDVLSISHVSKAYDRELFSDISCNVQRGEHIGLIGRNGTGKTTLFRLIMDMIESESGDIRLGANVSIGYYDQNLNILNENKSIYDEISNECGDLTETEIRNSLAAFSFYNDDVFKTIGKLSGGEKGRLSLCKLMLSNANLLLLDEPSNHLDMESKEILEKAINNYTGTVIFISHDRFFLNSCAHMIWEIDGCTLRNYVGNYDYYIKKKQDLIDKGLIKQSQIISEDISKPVNENRLLWEEEKRRKKELEKKKRDEQKTMAKIVELENKVAEIEEEESKVENASNYVFLKELMEEKDRLSAELLELYNNL